MRHEASYAGTSNGLFLSLTLTIIPGASLTFTVYNTTSVQIALGNALSADHELQPKDKSNQHKQVILTPAKIRLTRAGPVDVVVSTNFSFRATYHKKASGIITIVQSLGRTDAHTLRVTLCPQEMPSTMQFEGVWIEPGGQLAHSTAGIESMDRAYLRNMDRLASFAEPKGGKRSRQLVEIMAPSAMLHHNYEARVYTPHSDISWPVIWPNLMEYQFVNTTVSLVPVSSSSCITRQCQSKRNKRLTNAAPMANEIFFRAGSPETDLYRRLWSFSSPAGSMISPAALVLILGTADVETFLELTPRSRNEIDGFVDEFSRMYSNFIQTIRRTAYSSASLATHQILDPDYQEMTIDKSFWYNSAPSTIPIFLVLQPLPSPLLHSHTDLMRALLHHATAKVINELKWHIGDKKTFVVDTAGWLIDEDFHQASEAASNSFGHFSLTQTGHIKFAHHMSLHLCHYLLDRPTGRPPCPFDGHDDYKGNLYVPKTAEIAKLLEEKKVQKIKDMFGVFEDASLTSE